MNFNQKIPTIVVVALLGTTSLTKKKTDTYRESTYVNQLVRASKSSCFFVTISFTHT